MEDKILFVGGNWDLSGGRPSALVAKFAQVLKELNVNLTLYNGGNYENLNQILNLCSSYNIIIWWANVPNDLPKIRNAKDINFKAMLVSSKRNLNNQYSLQQILQKTFELKSNLVVEFSNIESKYYMRLFDPLGNLWYEGECIKECANKLLERLNLIKSITRQSTISAEENSGALDWFFNIFKQEMYKSDELPIVPIKKHFLEIVKNYANIFAKETFKSSDVKRFLGNASFRCPKGFPSFRDGKYIFVSKRNVNKQCITIEEFVPVYLKEDKVYYCGNSKPSVDTPIQVRLYNKFPNINYMIHSHCYIKNAPYTKTALPCGALEEISEIENLIKDNFNNDYTKDLYLINLKGHGSIMMSNNAGQLENISIIGRELPERMF